MSLSFRMLMLLVKIIWHTNGRKKEIRFAAVAIISFLSSTDIQEQNIRAVSSQTNFAAEYAANRLTPRIYVAFAVVDFRLFH